MNNYVIWEPKKRGSHIPFTYNLENSHFIPLKFVPQNGPQCGFAALCMVASSVGLELKPDDLVFEAKLKNMTNHGEMFSAEKMATFAQEILPVQFHVTLESCSIKGLYQQFKNYLLNDNLILIPYDCDSNNEPCLKNGAGAHWAVLCGFIDGGSENTFFVLACHGKSRYVSAWNFNDLQASNDNLNDLGHKRRLDKNTYVLPEGGLRSGIASKWIHFKKI